jgi:hypothetical protein
MRMRKQKDVESPNKTAPVNGNGNGTGHHGVPPAPPEIDLPVEVEVVKLDTSQLNSAGHLYQRPVDVWYVERLVENFSWTKFGTPFVNMRPDGSYWVVDGQHRIDALRQKFGDREWWFYLTRVAGTKEEAEIFAAVNDGHGRPKPAVLFQGRLTRREPTAVEIERIVQEEGMSLNLLNPKESEFEIASVSALDTIYKRGPEALRAVLRFVRRTWGGQEDFASSAVLTGVAKFFEHYGEHKAFDADRISAVIAEHCTVAESVRRAKFMAGDENLHRYVAFAATLRTCYNNEVPARERIYRKEGGRKRKSS